MAQAKNRNQPRRRVHHAKPVVSTGPEQPKNTKLVLAGYAVLGKDPITGFKMWKTFDGEGNDHVNLSPAQPLTFPVAKLQIGTKIELYVPVSVDDNIEQVQNVSGGDQDQETAPGITAGNDTERAP